MPKQTKPRPYRNIFTMDRLGKMPLVAGVGMRTGGKPRERTLKRPVWGAALASRASP
jgi:hypothetical protein